MVEWVITCNLSYYDIEGAFKKLKKIDWKQSTNIKSGDIVFIYVGKPYSAIRYKCIVNKVDLTTPEIDDIEFNLDNTVYSDYERYMKLELQEKYDNIKLKKDMLLENGLKTIQGPSRASDELVNYISVVTESLSLAEKKTRRKVISILMRGFARPVTARELTNLMYGSDVHQSNVFNELQVMEEKGLIVRSGTATQYYFSLNNTNLNPHYFYVFQNQSFNEECSGEYMWTPKLSKNGIENHHWLRMRDIKKGDVILHGYNQMVAAISVAKRDAYSAQRPQEISDEWDSDGWRVDTEYFVFKQSIKPKDYYDKIKILQPDKYAPFDKNGNDNMGYLYEANKKLGEYILNMIAGSNEDTTSMQAKAVVNKTLQLKLIEFDKTVHDGETEMLDKINIFVSNYAVKKLTNLTKEEYVYGAGSKDTFCYRVTHELYWWGSIRNGTPNKYGFYYNPQVDDLDIKYRTNKVFGNTDTEAATEEAFINVKLAIFELLVAGNNEDFDAIQSNPLSTIFKGKLLCIYYPEKYMNIYSREHAKYYMNELGMRYDENDGFMMCLQQIIAWKNENPITKDWSNHEFSKFLYHVLGYPPDREKQKKAIKKYEKKMDDDLIDEIDDVPAEELPDDDSYIPTPEERKDPVSNGENYSYPRNRETALKALKRANYECELDKWHSSFIRKSNGTNYTEPHHLVPMSEQDSFKKSLDVQANIVSLCSNCHNELHYGKEPESLLKKLYDARRDELEVAGILITFDRLLKCYL